MSTPSIITRLESRLSDIEKEIIGIKYALQMIKENEDPSVKDFSHYNQQESIHSTNNTAIKNSASYQHRKLKDEVLLVLKENNNTEKNIKYIIDTVQKSGTPYTRNLSANVSSTLTRLKRAKIVKNTSKGNWVIFNNESAT